MSDREPSGWAAGWTMFAGVMMIATGVFQGIQGLAAIINDEFVAVTPNYVFKFDVTMWGWIHLLVGLLILLAGFAVFNGAVWARTIGVIMAALVAIANFAWLPYHPVWATVIIAMSIAVIWALTAHGRDIVRIADE